MPTRPRRPAMPAAALMLAALLAPLAARAESQAWRLTLGQGEIGTLAFSDADGALTLAARLSGTPLGVADGAFDATSGPATAADGAVVRQYLGRSAFTTGGRTVSILSDAGGVREVTIDPEGDRTELSDPARAPQGALDLAQAFGALARSGGCPAFRLYDGRRVAEIATAPAGEGACEGRYRVVEGPGLLSPLSIREISLTATYAAGALDRLALRSGPFELALSR